MTPLLEFNFVEFEIDPDKSRKGTSPTRSHVSVLMLRKTAV